MSINAWTKGEEDSLIVFNRTLPDSFFSLAALKNLPW
jgi:hypothetical protein